MPAVIRNGQATAGSQGIEAAQRVVDMADAILLLHPSETPFTVLLRKLMKKEAGNPEFKWLEDEAVPWVDQINNAAGYTAGDTNLVVDNGSYFAPSDLVKVFRTGEVMRVTAVSGNTITVTRGWAGTAAALVDNDYLFIIASAFKEGASIGDSRATKKVVKTNYTEIFRNPVKLTKTLEASKLYGVSSERAYQRAKAGREHNMAMERAFWFGGKREDVSGTEPIRSTGGVFEWIVTNKTTLANEAAFTKAEFDKFLEGVFFYGSDERWVFASPLMVRLINGLADSSIRILQMEVGRAGDRTFGIQISRYQSAHGVVNIVNTRLFKDYRTAGDIAGKVLVAVDIDNEAAAYRYLRATKLYTDIQTPSDDAYVDEYLTECGLQFGQERRHGILEING